MNNTNMNDEFHDEESNQQQQLVVSSLNDTFTNIQIYDDDIQQNNIITDPMSLLQHQYPDTIPPDIVVISSPSTYYDDDNNNIDDDEDWGDPFPLEADDETNGVLTEEELIFAIHQLNFDPISDDNNDDTKAYHNNNNNNMIDIQQQTGHANGNDDICMPSNDYISSNDHHYIMSNQNFDDLPDLVIQDFDFGSNDDDFILDDVDHIFDNNDDNDDNINAVNQMLDQESLRNENKDGMIDQKDDDDDMIGYNNNLSDDISILSENNGDDDDNNNGDDGDVIQILDQLDKLFIGTSYADEEKNNFDDELNNENNNNDNDNILELMNFFDPFHNSDENNREIINNEANIYNTSFLNAIIDNNNQVETTTTDTDTTTHTTTTKHQQQENVDEEKSNITTQQQVHTTTITKLKNNNTDTSVSIIPDDILSSNFGRMWLNSIDPIDYCQETSTILNEKIAASFNNIHNVDEEKSNTITTTQQEEDTTTTITNLMKNNTETSVSIIPDDILSSDFGKMWFDSIDDDQIYYCQPCEEEEEVVVVSSSTTITQQDRINNNNSNNQKEVVVEYCQPCKEEVEVVSSPNTITQHISNNTNNQNEAVENDNKTSNVTTISLLAKPIIDAFTLTSTSTTIVTDDDDDDDVLASSPKNNTNNELNEKRQILIGHTERIMGCDFSKCGKYFATASQDSTVRIWKISNGKCIKTLSHDRKFESLRVTWASNNWGSSKLLRRFETTTTKYLLATGSADGIVRLYGTNDPEYDNFICLTILDHSTFKHFDPLLAQDPDDKPQIYSLQFIDDWKALSSFNNHNDNDKKSEEEVEDQCSFLLTSSDDHIHLWEVDDTIMSSKENNNNSNINNNTSLNLREVFSIRFSDWNVHYGYGVNLCQVTENGIFKSFSEKKSNEGNNNNNNTTNGEVTQNHNRNDGDNNDKEGGGNFGGDRNPHNLIFVFDSSYCHVNGLLSVALSDGTLRLINGRGVCLSILQLPGTQSHLTSFGWDKNGTRLASSVATGHCILWRVEYNKSNMLEQHSFVREEIQKSCCAVLSGGHITGKPLFGVQYISLHDNNHNNNNEELILTWGVDGRLCLWDSNSRDEIDTPISILFNKPNYPIYAVSVIKRHTKHNDDNNKIDCITIAIVGGDRPEKGESGIPVYLYDIDIPP